MQRLRSSRTPVRLTDTGVVVIKLLLMADEVPPIVGQSSAKLERVAICIPSGDFVHADFAISLAELMCDPGAACALVNAKGSVIAENRNRAVDDARKFNVDWILFLDSDMLFPPNTLRLLLSRGKDIVGATYVKRALPYKVLGKPLAQTIRANTGVIEMAGLPAGCLLISMRVFDQLKRPYFRTPAIEEAAGVPSSLQGEDYYFCEVARAAGFKIWMDVDLSKAVGHIGQFVYRIPIEQ